MLMGYPYAFDELVIVDLPSEDRHPLYQDESRPSSWRPRRAGDLPLPLDDRPELLPVRVLRPRLQRPEHRARDPAPSGQRAVQAVEYSPRRIPGLDTPNSRLTRLQQDAFIDPDHKYEYSHREMAALLRGHASSSSRRSDQLRRGVGGGRRVRRRRGGHRARPLPRDRRLLLLSYVCRARSDCTPASSSTGPPGRSPADDLPARVLRRGRRLLGG